MPFAPKSVYQKRPASNVYYLFVFFLKEKAFPAN